MNDGTTFDLRRYLQFWNQLTYLRYFRQGRFSKPDGEGMSEVMPQHGSALYKNLLQVAIPLGAIIATVFAVWVGTLSSSVSTHDEKGFHEGVRQPIQEAIDEERVWNEAENWKQEQRFNAQFVEVRSDLKDVTERLAEANTLLKVLEERTRPED